MLGHFDILHEEYGHPALDACRTFTYGKEYVKDVGYIYGYTNESNTVSFWIDDYKCLFVSFFGSRCLGRVFASLTEKEKKSLLSEIDTLGEHFPFFER